MHRFAALVGLLLALAGLVARAEPAGEARRVVSLNPSLTAILLALDARDLLVGVDDYSAQVQPELADLPRVGGLFNPSLEAIVGLSPDLVVLVPSAQQRSLRERLTALGVEVLGLENITLGQLLASIETLGARVGKSARASDRVDRIRAAFAEASGLAQGRASPRTVLILQRDPLYVVGRGSFLDEMLAATGARNLGAAFDEPYPRVGIEWLIDAAPELLLDASDDPEPAARHWSRWPSLPAVANGRVVAIPASRITLPGPALDEAVALLGAAVRGEPVP